MEATTLNPLALALVGAPTLIGLYFRLKRWNPRAFRANAIVSCAVMSAVAVGYAFATFDHPNPFFAAYSHRIVVVVLGVGLVAGMLAIIRANDVEGYLAIPIALVGYAFLAYGFCNSVPASYAMPLAALTLFCGLGLANAALGPFAIGFSISATLNSFFSWGTLDYVAVWQSVFDLFEISHTGVKLMMIGTTCLTGSGDVLAWLASRVLDGDG